MNTGTLNQTDEMEEFMSKIMDKVQKSRKRPIDPTQLIKQVSGDPTKEEIIRNAIRALVDRGNLLVTIDWKLRKKT